MNYPFHAYLGKNAHVLIRASLVAQMVKESACNANPGSLLGSERSTAEENGNPLLYSYLEYSMDRGAWWATVHHGVAKSWTQLSY